MTSINLLICIKNELSHIKLLYMSYIILFYNKSLIIIFFAQYSHYLKKSFFQKFVQRYNLINLLKN